MAWTQLTAYDFTIDPADDFATWAVRMSDGIEQLRAGAYTGWPRGEADAYAIHGTPGGPFEVTNVVGGVTPSYITYAAWRHTAANYVELEHTTDFGGYALGVEFGSRNSAYQWLVHDIKTHGNTLSGVSGLLAHPQQSLGEISDNLTATADGAWAASMLGIGPWFTAVAAAETDGFDGDHNTVTYTLNAAWYELPSRAPMTLIVDYDYYGSPYPTRVRLGLFRLDTGVPMAELGELTLTYTANELVSSVSFTRGAHHRDLAIGDHTTTPAIDWLYEVHQAFTELYTQLLLELPLAGYDNNAEALQVDYDPDGYRPTEIRVRVVYEGAELWLRRRYTYGTGVYDYWHPQAVEYDIIDDSGTSIDALGTVNYVWSTGMLTEVNWT